MKHPLRVIVITTLAIVGLGVPIASTAPAPGLDRLAMASISMEASRVMKPAPTPEEMLLDALNALRSGDQQQALKNVDKLLDREPTFRLAHLVRGDILASIGGNPTSIANKKTEDKVEHLIAEARQRLIGTTFEPGERTPSALIQLSDQHRYVVFVDTDISRLYLFENRSGDAVLVDDYYISIGKNGSRKRVKGDKRTPLGVYFVTERLLGKNLPDRYGPMAFPVNYPNEWDLRNKRTGSGIWLHGVASRSYSRPPQDSDGCIALINEEIERLSPMLDPGSTPVIIGSKEDWLDYQEVQQRRQELSAMVEGWRTDWESGDVEKYLSHYDQDFYGKGMDLRAWRDYKRRVAMNKKNISVELDGISIFAYPDEEDMVVVTFRQHYESNNFNGTTRKRQYWRKNADGQWRIITEASATSG